MEMSCETFQLPLFKICVHKTISAFIQFVFLGEIYLPGLGLQIASIHKPGKLCKLLKLHLVDNVVFCMFT